MEYFKRELDEYKTDIDPIKNYYQQLTTFISKWKQIDKSEAANIAKKIIKEHAVNPTVEYRVRSETGDRSIETTKLTDYIKDTVKDGDVLVPSFTVYDHPKKKKSLHAEFLKKNIENRSRYKKLSFQEYQKGNYDLATRYDVLQRVMKIFNNSLSGAYASKSTILYNPSQHYTLTSITRSVASIGNAVTESVVAGNKNFYTPEAVINYITAVITTVDMKLVNNAISVYKLHIPTVDEVIDMIKHSSDWYWNSERHHKIIREYLEKLSGTELATVMYVNDLHHLRKYNESFVRNFIGSLAQKVPTGAKDPYKAITTKIEGITNLAHHICMEEIQGKNINYDKLKEEDPKLLDLLGSTADNIIKVLDKHKLLLNAFFTTDILPIDIGNIKDCYRECIVLSDTDSTCGSYDKWTEWYFGYNKFTPEAVALSAAVMTINTQVIDHNIRVFAKNMNIDNDLVGLLKMKNEFFWSAFVTANVSKHYFANTWIQEGNVYAKPKMELKGVHLIASSGNQNIVTKAHDNMKRVLKMIEDGEKLSAKEILTEVANTERMLLQAIDEGHVDIFKLDKIKEKEAYKTDDPTKSPYFHHMLWKDVFEEKYGNPGEPTYMVIKIPTYLDSKRKMKEYLESLEDIEIKEKLEKALNKYGKETLGTFRIPLAIAAGKGVPKEIIQAVNKKRVILDNMNIYYIFLETLGLYRKDKLLFSEMGY